MGLPLLLAAIWLGEPWFTAVVFLAGSMAAWELGRLAEGTGAGPVAPVLSTGTVLVLLQRRLPEWQLSAVLALLMGIALVWSLLVYLRGGPARGWLWAGGGALYLGLPLWYYLGLRDQPQGAAWVTLALGAVFANDTAAYAVGRLLGKHRMAPRVSPGKTWEGAAGGVIAAAAAGGGLGALLGLPSGGQLALVGLAAGVAGQTGDLVESMLKRDAGTKDAGGLVPGHGGVLDRLDSLVFAGPLVYHYAEWLSTQ